MVERGDLEPLPAHVLQLQKKAEEGSGAAALQLGEIYAQGQGISPDVIQAEAWLRRAIELEERLALHRLGQLMLQTSDQGQDVDRASQGLRVLQEGAKTHPECHLTLGLYYASGTYVSRDFAKAEAHFRKAAEQGSADGHYRLGWLHAGEAGFPEQIDSKQALASLENAFLEGQHMEAGRLLVRLLREGTVVPKDEKKAFQLVAEAADRGNPDACFFLGQCYEKGMGVLPDAEKALETFQRAAELGSGAARNRVGLMYLRGEAGLAEDRAKAKEWFTNSAAVGFPSAHYNLAMLLDAQAKPDTFEQRLAVEHMMKAANLGFTEAQDRLGSWYRDGKNVSQDVVAATAWFRLAANRGHLASKINLGRILETLPGQANSLATAIGLYQEAASAGHPVGHYHLARILASGVTGRLETVSSFAHLAAAADAGLPAAKSLQTQVSERMTEEQLAAANQRKERLVVFPWQPPTAFDALEEEEEETRGDRVEEAD